MMLCQKTLAQDGQSLAIGSAPMQIPLGTSAPTCQIGI